MNHKKIDDKIFISIDKGELVNQKLLEVAETENLKSGWINGLGAISDIEIGYWDIEKKVYVKQKFGSDYELLSLIGFFENLSILFSDSGSHFGLKISVIGSAVASWKYPNSNPHLGFD